MTLGVQPSSSLYQFLNYHDPLTCLTLICISLSTTSCQRISLQGISSSTAPFLQIESAMQIVFNLRNYFLTSKYFRRCDVPLPLPCCHTLCDPGNISRWLVDLTSHPSRLSLEILTSRYTVLPCIQDIPHSSRKNTFYTEYTLHIQPCVLATCALTDNNFLPISSILGSSFTGDCLLYLQHQLSTFPLINICADWNS